MALEFDEKLVSQGNLTALNQAFEGLAKSDGHAAEELDVAIGKSIARNPINFLKAYQRNETSVSRLDALVGNLGPEYVDDFPRQAVELRKRIKALQSVKSKSLKPLALKCIKELKRALSTIDAIDP